MRSLEAFWRDDHFGEYLHPEHGLVDTHGLSDVNWAAVAFDLADDRQRERLWPRLMGEPAFWAGDMPTHLVTKPFAYASWESSHSSDCSVDPFNDVAAMGRVWYLEATACRRMKAWDRLDGFRAQSVSGRPGRLLARAIPSQTGRFGIA